MKIFVSQDQKMGTPTKGCPKLSRNLVMPRNTNNQ